MSQFLKDSRAKYPFICGAMYPCSNPELVAAASEAGALGIIQPVSLVFAHGYKFADGLKKIQTLTKNPLGINVLVEKSSKKYEQRMKEWLDIAIDQGVLFAVTALGNPKWVVEKMHAAGGKVYHDVTELKWAKRAMDSGVDGFICVNQRAGGHAGHLSSAELVSELQALGKPLICAGGVATHEDFLAAIKLGYAGVQLGSRFIASTECTASNEYKNALVKAREEDIVLTPRLTGVNVAVIRNEAAEKLLKSEGWLGKFLRTHSSTKHYTRLFYTIKSLFVLRKTNKQNKTSALWQAGKSVSGIDEVLSCQEIVKQLLGDKE